ncbi:conserved hypothetical protein [Neospora caninum Liverpool]|uniref:Uncharacterized protein n=1 Tax=Neospora caninum (strain Liverpool) TaxID=572307 RepID=F0VRQ2_NEOCL|nr:conserved hypothetical protein [Neospora caninum Liverpool]CBZ56400.1 conserved hypothetical protein [Neospora caninum Liverpool]|eukprot:XP_003886425.1 conserved hypothetical protein [Neospora caninum Liverpool]
MASVASADGFAWGAARTHADSGVSGEASAAPPCFRGHMLWRRCLKCLRIDADSLWERLRLLTDEIVENGLRDLSAKIAGKRVAGVQDPCLEVLHHPVIQRICTERAYLAELAVYRTWLDRYRVLEPPAVCECGYEREGTAPAAAAPEDPSASPLAELNAEQADEALTRRQKIQALERELRESEEEEQRLQVELDQLLTEIVDENRENVRLRTRLACAEQNAHASGNFGSTRDDAAQDEAGDFAALIQDVTRRCAKLSMMASCLANAGAPTEEAESSSSPFPSRRLPLSDGGASSPARARGEEAIPRPQEPRRASCSLRSRSPSAVATPGLSAGNQRASGGVHAFERGAEAGRQAQSERRRLASELETPWTEGSKKRRREDRANQQEDTRDGEAGFEREIALRQERRNLSMALTADRRAVTPPRVELHASRRDAQRQSSQLSGRRYGSGERESARSSLRGGSSWKERERFGDSGGVNPSEEGVFAVLGGSLPEARDALPSRIRSLLSKRRDEDEVSSEEFLSIGADESPLLTGRRLLAPRDDVWEEEGVGLNHLRSLRSSLLGDATSKGHKDDGEANRREGRFWATRDEERSPTPVRGVSAEHSASRQADEQNTTREEETSSWQVRREENVGSTVAHRLSEGFLSTERQASRRLNRRQPGSPAAAASEAAWADLCLETAT